jgi:hypothetical protein
MVTRRALIQNSIAAGVGLAALLPFEAIATAMKPTFPFHSLLVDARVDAGRRFAGEARRFGMTIHDADAAPSEQWYRELRGLWQSGEGVVAGLTSYATFFSLRMMSDHLRIRPEYIGYHHLQGAARHELFGPASLVGSARLANAAHRWPSDAARLVLSWSPDGVIGSVGNSTLALAAERPLTDGSLVSWILAPRSQEFQKGVSPAG